MFVGHFATAFAAKRADQRASLATYLTAAVLPDILFTLLLLAGIEHAEVVPGHTAMTPLRLVFYPYSHSLLACLLQSLVLLSVYWLWRRRLGPALLVGALPLGHWLLDVISHVPDVPVGLAGPFLGLGLWRSVAATFALEGALFAAGVLLYYRATRSTDGIGRWSTLGFLLFLTAAYVSGPFSPPPPSVQAVAVVNASLTLTLLWAAWFDRHRAARTPLARAR